MICICILLTLNPNWDSAVEIKRFLSSISSYVETLTCVKWCAVHPQMYIIAL